MRSLWHFNNLDDSPLQGAASLPLLAARKTAQIGCSAPPDVASLREGDWAYFSSLNGCDETSLKSNGGVPLGTSPEDLVWMTPKLPGQVKWAFVPIEGYVLRAELPIELVGANDRNQADVEEGFTTAQALLGKKSCLNTPVTPSTLPEPFFDQLCLLCSEAGWTASRAPHEQVLKVDLDAGVGAPLASISVSNQSIKIHCEICGLDRYSARSVEALASFILRTNAALRWVRGGFSYEDGRPVAGVEISLGLGADITALSKALSALSVACGACAREAAALAVEDIAVLFLEVAVGMGGKNIKT